LAKRRASEEPPGKPRAPCRRAASTALHVSPGAFTIGPESSFGHRSVRRWCASAHSRTCATVYGGSALRLRTPRCSERSLASEEPGGKPRRPQRRALSTEHQVSSTASRMRPTLEVGHRDNRLWKASAHANIWATVSRGLGLAHSRRGRRFGRVAGAVAMWIA
jgi:hypothetical protein